MNYRPYYDPNKPYYLRRSIARAERKLMELHIRRQISNIDFKLKVLKDMQAIYPPQKTDDAQPSAVHISAPSPS